MPPTLLEGPLVDDTLKSLPGWSGDKHTLWREVHLPPDLDQELRRQVDVDSTAMGHAAEAEQVEGGTRYVLTTHDVGGVSELDVALAARISDLAHQLSSDEPGVHAVRRKDDDVDIDVGDTEALELSTQPEKVRAQVRF
jgi:4a-hydroxytetrahydrobiopterin dehydratase